MVERVFRAAPWPVKDAMCSLYGWRLHRLRYGGRHGQHLAPGHRLDGPAVVTEAGSTTVVPPGWKLRVDGHANLRLAPEGG